MNGTSDETYGRIAAWLAVQAQGDTGIDEAGQQQNNIGALALPDLFAGFCSLVSECVSPLWRCSMGIEVLNPELSGAQLIWRDGALTRTEIGRAGMMAREDYIKSPIYVVDTTNRPFRWNISEAVPDMETIQRLAGEGATDYFVLPLPFQDATRTSTFSFCTKKAGGFTGPEIEGLAMAARLWSPFAERWTLRHIALDLLAHYLGRAPAERVYNGQIERGDVSMIDAAILICDLRGFTAMTDRSARGAIVALLNRWFECIGAAIQERQGDILKFMGDGLLAVFPMIESQSATCGRALDAAQDALARTDALNEDLAAEGIAPLRFGIGLHWGEVEFGNIGTRDRLDFTVIGPAVNLASRLQDLTKILMTPILASAEFAAASRHNLRHLDTRPLRGLADQIAVFAP